MADDNAPNDASRKSKAEGERWNESEEAGGISNRPLDEEAENQEALPERGESQPGAHAGHGDADREPRRSER
jgi:hypothetical protein